MYRKYKYEGAKGDRSLAKGEDQARVGSRPCQNRLTMGMLLLLLKPPAQIRM